MKSIKILVLFVSLVLICITASASNPEEAATFKDVKTKTVCFIAHNGEDPVDVPITGTLFYNNSYNSSSKVIVAVHGFVSNRSVWDGGMLGYKSFARALASAGYVVITYDRLGYGQSPYIREPGSGFTITEENQLANLREIIAQIKEGSYTETTTTCPSGTPAEFGFEKIILTGHSGGAAIIESYAGLNHDVNAIIPIAFSSYGSSNMFYNEIILPWIVPNIYSGKDYVTMFPPNTDGNVSEECVRYFFHKHGAKPDMYNSVCSNENLIPSPSGEYLTAFDFWENKTRERIKSIGSLPVLLVFADHDLLFIGPKEANSTDPDKQSIEISYWQQNCGCNLSVFTQKNSGHMLMLHKSVNSTISTIIEWLHNHNL